MSGFPTDLGEGAPSFRKNLEPKSAIPVAPMTYQLILEPGIGQFREFESPPSAYSYKFVGTFSCAQIDLAESARAWVSNTR